MRQREAEHKQRTDAMTVTTRDFDLKVKSSTRELEQTRDRNTEMRKTVRSLKYQHIIQTLNDFLD